MTVRQAEACLAEASPLDWPAKLADAADLRFAVRGAVPSVGHRRRPPWWLGLAVQHDFPRLDDHGERLSGDVRAVGAATPP
jgi:hypothetical protein